MEPGKRLHRPSAREWAQVLSRYREPNHARSVFELAITAGAFAGLWVVMWFTLRFGYWLTLVVAVPAAGFLVRLFMIQHDCGHGAFFRHRLANDWVGRVIGVLTLTPYQAWRRSHAIHHASSGHLERRGIGDINTMTVAEYLASGWWRRLGYRLYRNPIVMLGLGPAFLFIVQHRLPIRLVGDWRPWISAMATNAALALIIVMMIWLVGIGPFLLVHVPITLLAASIGVWLFYVQHQFEETWWAKAPAWNLHDAALHGSSHYDLPAVLRWFTANIGMHHLHHLCSRIPYYRLPHVLRDHPQLRDVGRLTLMESFRCVRLALWDERSRRLISFGDLRRQGHDLAKTGTRARHRFVARSGDRRSFVGATGALTTSKRAFVAGGQRGQGEHERARLHVAARQSDRDDQPLPSLE